MQRQIDALAKQITILSIAMKKQQQQQQSKPRNPYFDKDEKYRRGRPTPLDLTIKVPASFRASTSENYLQWRGPQPQLVVTETQLIKEILSNKDGAFVKTKPSSYGKKLIGDGIVVTRGEKWSSYILYQQFQRRARVCAGNGPSNDTFGSSYLEGKNIFDMLIKLSTIISRNEFKIRFPGIGDGSGSGYGAVEVVAATILMVVEVMQSIQIGKARKEVLELFGQQNPSPEGITRLKSMSMILNETLRLYSPAANMWRKVEREVRLGKLVLPANMDVYIPSLALHHDPNIWGKDAHLFKPERFSEGVAKATNNNTAAFIPFGLGCRMCVGLNFAATETKIAISMILQRYTFTLSPTYVHSPMQMLTIRPKQGIEVETSTKSDQRMKEWVVQGGNEV
ncbi:hypothetical protein HYC85_023949 [Camellia sinensis]|uniref:Cytochrome P450 n=1 Tax=Camellia sinensis TaxID=4442 RepID=A0A7J7GG06_CAMSI|nr:hypothetical protein HYC85_023949 [Camellia sinensis]